MTLCSTAIPFWVLSLETRLWTASGGGYRLADAMSTIPVAKIIAAVDEELQFTRCDGDAVEGCVCSG